MSVIKGIKEFVGKEVQIYPNDTYKKYGILLEVSEHGFLFKITESKADNYKKDDLLFIAHATGVTMLLRKK